jgi:TolA-binding protein
MTLPRITIVLLSVSLWNCSLVQTDSAPTIGSLDPHALDLEDTQLESSDQKAMHAYRRFLETDDDSDTRRQAMRRLADINLESEVLPQDSTGDVFPGHIKDSIVLYEDILARYPERAENDRVLYQLARAYEANGEVNKSLDTLLQLINRYPNSTYMEEARFRRGEILFVQKDYEHAGIAYRQVVEAGNSSPFYLQSLYKLGWCYFKQSQLEEGLNAFMALLDLKLASPEDAADYYADLSRAEREIVDDTLRVISLSFSYEAGPETVSDYFSRHGSRHYEDLLYSDLGKLYLDKQRYTDAAQTFRMFAEQNPYHEQAPQFYIQVINTYQRGKFPTLVLQEKKAFVDRYNLQRDYWNHHNVDNSEPVLEYLKKTVIDLSRHYHALAQRTHKPDDYRETAHWYRVYLGSFPDSEAAPEMNFLLAEILYESGDYQAAVTEYEHTAYDYDSHEKDAEAGYATVLAYNKATAAQSGENRQAWQQRSIENGLRFSSTFPAHPQATAVLTKTSESLLEQGDLERAQLASRQVIDNPDTSPTDSRVAWAVHAHASFDLQDYLKAEQAYARLLQLTRNDKDEQAKLNERLAASIYKQGELAGEQGDTGQAVGHFLRVREAAPASSIAPTAEFDAAAGLMQLKEWQQAAAVMQRLRTDYPDHPKQPEITRRLAAAYLENKQPLQAAAELERIGNSGDKPELQREALWQSAELYMEAQRPEQSVAIYRQYIERFDAPAESLVEARQRIAAYYRANNDTRQYHHWLGEVIRADRDAAQARTDRTRYLAAKAQLTLAEASYEKYLATDLVLPLKRSLTTKKKLMEQVLEQYGRAVEYQVAEVTTAATFRIADSYYHLSQALLESQRPAGLSADALVEYDILLEDQAYPFEEKAIALHESNISRVSEDVYDEWTRKSMQQLAELVPARYAKTERGVMYVESIY